MPQFRARELGERKQIDGKESTATGQVATPSGIATLPSADRFLPRFVFFTPINFNHLMNLERNRLRVDKWRPLRGSPHCPAQIDSFPKFIRLSKIEELIKFRYSANRVDWVIARPLRGSRNTQRHRFLEYRNFITTSLARNVARMTCFSNITSLKKQPTFITPNKNAIST